MPYLSAILQESIQAGGHINRWLRNEWLQHSAAERSILLLTLCSTSLMGVMLLIPLYHRIPFSNMTWSLPAKPTVPVANPLASTPKQPPPIDLSPVRPEPKSFPIDTTWPRIREGVASGSIHQIPFNPERDLISIHHPDVWWESDNDDHTGDTEDDHLMHKCMREPFLRLVALVAEEAKKHPKGVVLKVQDSYRAQGVHAARSLHKQGRGLDITTGQPGNLRTPGIPLSKLAKLSWAAGFDWVYYESKGGHHIHVSKKP